MDIIKDGGLVNSDPGSDPLIGTVLDGTFEIQSRIGKGGMGSVYKAYHRHLERTVAVKVLRGYASRGQVVVQRFRQEARALSQLSHRNIVNCYNFGFHDDNCFMALDLIDGTTLAAQVEENGSLSTERFVKIFTQVLSALEHAHHQNIVHRDLKPENIMLVSEEGEADVVKIVDFGIAKVLDADSTLGQNLTRTGAFLGSPLYMSPEQCRGGAADHRSDLYSLGCVMYFAISGKAPFEDTGIVDIIRRHVEDHPSPLPETVPAFICNVIYTAMEKRPEDRFASAADMLVALQTTNMKAVTRRLPSKRNFSLARVVMKRKRVAGGAAILLILGLGIVVALSRNNDKLSRLEQASQIAKSGQEELVKRWARVGASKNRVWGNAELAVVDATDRLLQSRVAYANALLDSPDGMVAAIDISKEIDTDLTYQKKATDGFPALQRATVDGIAALGLRFAERGQNDAAANCIVAALYAYQQRAVLERGQEAVNDVAKLVELTEKAHNIKLDSSCQVLASVIPGTELNNRPHAYLFATRKAMEANDQAMSKRFARRAYETISDINVDKTCPISTDNKGLEYVNAGFLLASLQMDTEAIDLFRQAGQLCRMDKPDPGTGAPTAAFLLAFIGSRNNMSKDQMLSLCDTAIRTANVRKFNILPFCNFAAQICQAAGDAAGREKYIKEILSADAFATLPPNLPPPFLKDAMVARGALLLEKGKPAEAQRSFDEYLEVIRPRGGNSGDASSFIVVALDIGNIYYAHNLLKQADRYYRMSLTESKRKEDYTGVAHAIHLLSGIDLKNSDYHNAKSLIDKYLPMVETKKAHPFWLGALYHHRCNAEINLNQLEAARSDAMHASELFGPNPIPEFVRPAAAVKLCEGMASNRLGKYAEAEKPLRESIEFWNLATTLHLDPAQNAIQLKYTRAELALALQQLGRTAEANRLTADK